MSEFTCNGISRSFKNFQLDHISFSMESGYFYVLIGVNGSGKTTLLNCISGVTDQFTGDARIDGALSEKHSGRIQAETWVYQRGPPLLSGKISSGKRGAVQGVLSELVFRRLPPLPGAFRAGSVPAGLRPVQGRVHEIPDSLRPCPPSALSLPG